MEEEVLTQSAEETEEFGRRLAGRLTSKDVVYLIGSLGAGKTCLARGLARGLGASVREVASPTFAILHEYASASVPDRAAPGNPRILLRHLDLYRLQDRAEELDILGLPDSISGAPVVVEWPGEAIRRVLPPTIEVALEVLPDESRQISVRHVTGAGY